MLHNEPEDCRLGLLELRMEDLPEINQDQQVNMPKSTKGTLIEYPTLHR
jgi:hypothetical protein